MEEGNMLLHFHQLHPECYFISFGDLGGSLVIHLLLGRGRANAADGLPPVTAQCEGEHPAGCCSAAPSFLATQSSPCITAPKSRAVFGSHVQRTTGATARWLVVPSLVPLGRLPWSRQPPLSFSDGPSLGLPARARCCQVVSAQPAGWVWLASKGRAPSTACWKQSAFLSSNSLHQPPG